LDQLRGQDPGFERFTQADHIRDQDPLTRLSEGLKGRVQLIRHQIHHATVPEVDEVIVWSAAPQLGLEVEQGAIEVGTGVRHQLGERRIQNHHFSLQVREEKGRPPPDQFGNAVAGKLVTPISGGVDPSDEPFLIADHNTGTRSVGKHGLIKKAEKVSCLLHFVLATVYAGLKEKLMVTDARL
jgi:hypothetical protein